MSSKATAVAERRRTLRVLIADTFPDDVRRIRELLGERGELLVTLARTPAEAGQLLAGGAFDVVLVGDSVWNDQEAPIARHLREHRDITVILLAGDDPREPHPALKLGVHDVVNKSRLGDADQLSARVLAAYDESRSLRRRDTMVRWLEREARTDHLTGLYNRRVFDERLRDICDAARRSNAATTLIIADLADTRTVNESHGHEVGDDMIRRAAQGVARCVRGTDFAARIAGDDFGIILEGADLELGKLVARRIAQELERLNANEWCHLIPVTLTFGVATGRHCEPAELFAAAEQAMTNNKTNRPVVTMLWPRIDSDGPSVA